MLQQFRLILHGYFSGDVLLNDTVFHFVCSVFKYRFAVPALVIYEPFLPFFSPCFTELKLWSWSSWRQFVS